MSKWGDLWKLKRLGVWMFLSSRKKSDSHEESLRETQKKYPKGGVNF
jgi:hypothetical protein